VELCILPGEPAGGGLRIVFSTRYSALVQGNFRTREANILHRSLYAAVLAGMFLAFPRHGWGEPPAAAPNTSPAVQPTQAAAEMSSAEITPDEIREMILDFLMSKKAQRSQWILASRKIIENQPVKTHTTTYTWGPWIVMPADKSVTLQAHLWHLWANYEKQDGKYVLTNVRILTVRR
jgi:hypothetical protein